MSMPDTALAREMLRYFDVTATDVRPYGTGHINSTFRVDTEDPATAYIFQCISPVAFHHPEQVMANVVGVTKFIGEQIAARGGDPRRETLTVIPTKNGESHVMDDENRCWRMFLCVQDAISYDLPESEDIFREAGRAFGAFQTALSEYPVETLYETIPSFHDTVSRVGKLRAAIEADAVGRAEKVQKEIDFAIARAERAGALLDQLAEGKIPLRVTHNDTKLNNVLLDAATGNGLCVIDLDTVMPGLSAYDFGDALRFGANTAVEDETDLDKIHFSMPMYRAWCEGYMSQAGETMDEKEIMSLPLGAWMMTYEVGIRFLTDYLDGDHYFHIKHPEHNIERARNQFALLADMEKYEDEMNAFIRRWVKE